MVQMLWNREPDDDERDNTMRSAVFAPMPFELHERFEQRFGLHAVTGFGLTEVGTIILCSVDDPAPIGWSGKALPSCEIIIADDNDEPLPPHTPGEILVRPLEPHIFFEGYFGDPDATLRVFKNLWFHTGDIGEKDAQGNVRFLDRKKDYLRRRGENISSMEAEAAVLRHEAIAEAAVIGVPSEMTEDEVKACVVLAPGATLTHEQILEHCIDTLPYFAVPRFVEIFESFPKTPSGKIQKAELRRSHAPGTAWDREAAGIKVSRETRRRRASPTS
jgi:crotonobetaine/carnitine-CoA ligase